MIAEDQAVTKDSILSVRLHPKLMKIIETLAKEHKWSRSLFCGEVIREDVIKQLRKKGGFDEEIEFLKTLR